MSCQVNFPLQDVVLLLREKISPEIIGAVSEEKLEEEVLLFIQPKIDELQEQLTKLPPEVHVVTQVLQDSELETTLNNGTVLKVDLRPLFDEISGLVSLYEKNVAEGGDESGWTDKLVLLSNGRNQYQKNLDLVTPFDFGAIGDDVYHKLSERYKTLEEAQVKYPSAQSLDDSIDLVALEAFFEYCHGRIVTIANISLTAKINRPLNLGVGGRTDQYSKTKVFYGSLVLSGVDNVELTHLMQINLHNTYFAGRITVNGTGSLVKDRKVMCGLLIGDRGTDGSSGRIHINEVYCGNLKYAGIILLNDSIFPMIDKVHAGWCGSTAHSDYTNTGDTHFANITSKLEDTPGDYGQRSKVAVDSLPPNIENNIYNVMAVFEGDDSRPYRVTDINTTNNTISVYPLLDTTKTYTKVKYIYGGGLFWEGNNSGVGTFNHLQFIVCGVGFWGVIPIWWYD